jgi:polyribonucleotide nucleotidyltransferase
VEAAEQAREMIREITVEAEVGKTYTGKVVRIEEYGAFVEILPNIVGLLHISEIAHHRTRHTRDVMKLGQTVKVKVLAVDEDNKIKLSKKALEPRPSGSVDSNRPYKKKYSNHDNRRNKNRF